MERHVSLDEISDGKLYGLNDMVRAGCGECEGCSACCRGMGTSIILDPLDIHRLSQAIGQSFEEMIDDKIELHVVDGMILPNLKMSGADVSCVFLNEEGRCSIHSARPGICRLFPLGRFYEGQSFRYFLQVHECKRENRTKVKVRKWIDTPELKKYQTFIGEWHYFLKDLQELAKDSGDDGLRRNLALHVLQQFYVTGYQADEDFYGQFQTRMDWAKKELLKAD